MLGPYRTILRMPGTLAFSATGWFARLPMSMIGLGIVLLVSAATGSYAVAGSVSASYIVGAAVFGPPQARLVDRLGQGRVLPAIAMLNALALGGLVLSVQVGLGAPVPHLFALVAGSTTPVIGSFVRARWTRLLEGKPELHTAYALEALLDEVVFMVGPPLATFLATSINPAAGLLAALGSGLVGALLLSVQRSTEPPAHRRPRDGTKKPPLGWRTLTPAIVASVGLGMLFGSVEVVVVAVTTEQGQRPMAGLLLAVWATGSMLSALIIGTVRQKSTPFTRFKLGATAMGLTMLPLPFLSNLGLLGVVLFLAGFAISPTMIAAIGIVERTVPASRLNEGITWVTTGLNAGVALGAAIVGPVIDGYGGSAGFFVPLAAGLVAGVVAWFSRTGDRPAPVDAVDTVDPAKPEGPANRAPDQPTERKPTERPLPAPAEAPTGPESTIDPVSPLDSEPAGCYPTPVPPASRPDRPIA